MPRLVTSFQERYVLPSARKLRVISELSLWNVLVKAFPSLKRRSQSTSELRRSTKQQARQPP
eukprot:scaffold67092_cov39-Tisochrysis_lutea.AAC.1